MARRAEGADLRADAVVRSTPQGRVVLDHLHAVFEPGTVTAVVGANGSGKSTLSRVLAGVDRPDAGAVHRPTGRAFLLAERAPALPTCSARTVLAALSPRLSRLSGVERHQRLEAALEELASTHPGDAPLARLSKGNLQKAHLAVAYALRPAVVLLDEPMTGLDPDAARAAGGLCRALAAEGCVVVLAVHDALAAAHANRRLVGGHLLAADAEPAVSYVVDLRSGTPAAALATALGAGLAPLPVLRPGRARLRVPAAELAAVLRAALDADLPVERVVQDDA